jgi:hypothetical protein
LTNEQVANARRKMNEEAGSRRLFRHAMFIPGQPGWLEKLDAALDLKPDSCKRYMIGDGTHKEISRFATRKAEYEKLGPEPSTRATAMWCRPGRSITRVFA